MRCILAAALAAAASAAAASAAAAAASFCSAPGWAPEWSDDFSGASLDPTSWTVKGSSEPDDSYCRAAQCQAGNVAVSGGALQLTARRQAAGWANFTTGAVDSRGKRSWGARPGAPVRICIGGTVPTAGGDGYWPAFWLMPDDSSCWPDHGELDLMEMINGDGVEHFTYHVSPRNTTVCKGGPVQQSEGGKQAVAPGAQHEYAVEIAMGQFAFAVDGAVVYNSTTADLPVHDVAWYVILNFALGKPWANSPTPDTTFPASTTVDYVRVARGSSGGV